MPGKLIPQIPFFGGGRGETHLAPNNKVLENNGVFSLLGKSTGNTPVNKITTPANIVDKYCAAHTKHKERTLRMCFTSKTTQTTGTTPEVTQNLPLTTLHLHKCQAAPTWANCRTCCAQSSTPAKHKRLACLAFSCPYSAFGIRFFKKNICFTCNTSLR